MSRTARIVCLLLTWTIANGTTSKAQDKPAPVTDDIQFKDCAAMQDYFNSLKWDVEDTTFVGFDKQPKNVVKSWRSHTYIFEQCFGGYKVEKSPLGTLVCRGYMERSGRYYVEGKYLRNDYTWYTGTASNSTVRDNCRYKD